MLMSATTSDDVEKLQRLVLHAPLTLNLLNPSGAARAGAGEGQQGPGQPGGLGGGSGARAAWGAVAAWGAD